MKEPRRNLHPIFAITDLDHLLPRDKSPNYKQRLTVKHSTCKALESAKCKLPSKLITTDSKQNSLELSVKCEGKVLLDLNISMHRTTEYHGVQPCKDILWLHVSCKQGNREEKTTYLYDLKRKKAALRGELQKRTSANLQKGEIAFYRELGGNERGGGN